MTDWLQKHKHVEKGAMMHSLLAAMKPWGLLSLRFSDQAAIKPHDTVNLCPSPPSQLSTLHKIHQYSYSKFPRDTLPDIDRQPSVRYSSEVAH